MGYIEDCIGIIIGVIEGDTWSLDYSSYFGRYCILINWLRSCMHSCINRTAKVQCARVFGCFISLRSPCNNKQGNLLQQAQEVTGKCGKRTC